MLLTKRDIEPQMEDEKILEWAVREQRIIVTTDNDFEQMIWQQQKSHCGILRLENVPRKEREVLLKYTCNITVKIYEQEKL